MLLTSTGGMFTIYGCVAGVHSAPTPQDRAPPLPHDERRAASPSRKISRGSFHCATSRSASAPIKKKIPHRAALREFAASCRPCSFDRRGRFRACTRATRVSSAVASLSISTRWAIGRMRPVLLKRLNRRRHEPDLVQPDLLLARPRKCQVSIVHRIKTTAKNAETHVEELGLGAGGWGLGQLSRYDTCLDRAFDPQPPDPPSPRVIVPTAITLRYRARAVGGG